MFKKNNNPLILMLLLFGFINPVAAQQNIKVDVSPTVKKYIKGHSELQREKYFNLAARSSELNKNLDNELFNRYMHDLDMTVGRKLFVVYSESRWGNGYREDATRPGFMDTTYFVSQKAPNDNGLEEYINLWGENEKVAAHDGHNAYPDFIDKYIKDGSTESFPENADAAAEMAAYTLKYAYSDFQRPKYFELVNEPDWRVWSDQRFIDWHTKTHQKFKAMSIPTEVGGPCFSVGYFYKNDFDAMKSIRDFMDATNFQLDFYSFHIYDYMKWSDDANDFVGRVSSGLPEEAVFDALAAHSKNKYGQEFTYVSSEHGGYVSDKTNLEAAQNALADQYFPGSGFLHEMEKRSISNFIMVNSAITNTLVFMNHPHVVKKSVPFILLESAGWDPKYYSSLLVKENFDKNSNVWHEAKLGYFYEFFKDVKGHRVHSVCNDNDIQQISLVDGNRLIMIFHNQSNTGGLLDLNVKIWDNNIQQVTTRRLGRQNDFRPYFSEETSSSLSDFSIDGQESVVVFVDYEKTVEQRSEIEVIPYYSSEVATQFTGAKEFTVAVENPTTVQSAELRIGLARDASESKEMLVELNGTTLNLPVEDCAGRLTNENEYGSMRSIEIDPALLKTNNTVKISFTDGKQGGIGAVVIRAATLKSGIPLSAKTIQKGTFKLFPNPAYEQLTIESGDSGKVSIVSMDGRTIMVQQLFKGQNQLNLSGLKNGSYIAHAQFQNDSISERFNVIK
ncbi:T9SS type A sorting domain-containing protein [uncultured Draconibacterium sp.]|uniref:T9SS type A sorting domain-containing protein n=1 Tax=uncultured Draconibacterium sp. TaxID=1573823 RepID=UPI0025EE0660|nr:T9SS type A sorting domain-containing protein [uncultured Draconibacterium sp.]